MKTKIKKPIKDNFISVTCTTEQKEKFCEIANMSGRTMAGYIRCLIEKVIEGEENNDRI